MSVELGCPRYVFKGNETSFPKEIIECEKLYIRWFDYSPSFFRLLFDTLSESTKLAHIYIWNDNIKGCPDLIIPYLCDFILKMKNLEYFTLTHSNNKSLFSCALLALSKNCSKLKNIDFHGQHQMPLELGDVFIELAKSNSVLTNLFISFYDSLFEFENIHTTLTLVIESISKLLLPITSLHIQCPWTKQIFDFLMQNISAKSGNLETMTFYGHFVLSKNEPITPNFHFILNAISKNPKLYNVDMSKLFFTGAFPVEFSIESLKYNTKMTSFSVQHINREKNAIKYLEKRGRKRLPPTPSYSNLTDSEYDDVRLILQLNSHFNMSFANIDLKELAKRVKLMRNIPIKAELKNSKTSPDKFKPFHDSLFLYWALSHVFPTDIAKLIVPFHLWVDFSSIQDIDESDRNLGYFQWKWNSPLLQKFSRNK